MTLPDDYAAARNRFTILLADERAASGSSRGRRDDDAATDRWHETVTLLLEPQGVTTVSARTGREALERIEASERGGPEGRIHVAVLGERLPTLGGLQVVRLARALPHAPPAVLLTRRASGHLLSEAIAMSVFSVLTKPVDPDVLLDTLARVMRRHYEGRWPE